jgi:hypothetical protein
MIGRVCDKTVLRPCPSLAKRLGFFRGGFIPAGAFELRLVYDMRYLRFSSKGKLLTRSQIDTNVQISGIGRTWVN